MSMRLKTVFGEGYIVRSSMEGEIRQTTEPPLFFSDTLSAKRFLRNFTAEPQFWASVAHKYANYRDLGPNVTPLDLISQLLVSRSIQIFKVPELHEYSRSKAFRDRNGDQVSLVAAAAVVAESSTRIRDILNPQAAEELLDNLSLDNDGLEDIVATLNLDPANHGGLVAPLDSVGAASCSARDLVANALSSGQIVAQNVSSNSTNSQNEAQTEEAPANQGPGDRPVEDSTEAAPPAEQTEEEPICELQKLTVACSHGRSAEMTKDSVATLSLDVVASETAKRGFEKITASVNTSGVCGEHTNSCTSITPAPKSTKLEALKSEYQLACDPISNPLKVLWLPSITPRTYKIAAKACNAFSPRSVEVNVYPNVKWNLNIAYSTGGTETKRELTETGSSVEHKDKASGFSGKVEYHYDEWKEDFSVKYKTGIDTILSQLNWMREKVDQVLKQLSGSSSVALEVNWPQFSAMYETSLAETSGANTVDSTYNIKLEANPLIGLKGSLDAFPPLLKTAKSSVAWAPVAVILEAAMKGVGSDTSVASLKAELSLIFTVESVISLNFSASGTNGNSDTDCKSEQALTINLSFEGTVGAKGHIWIVKFEKKYKAGIKSGFTGKIIIDKDDTGFYWYSRFLFNGLVLYFTKYEKLEKDVSNTQMAGEDFFGVPDEAENSATIEKVWLKPSPDKDEPNNTTGSTTGETDPSLRHYLIRF